MKQINDLNSLYIIDWPRGGMVTQRIANPFIPVRFWTWPPQKSIFERYEGLFISSSLILL